MSDRVVVIGSAAGGLAAAAHLAAIGIEVTVLEQASELGADSKSSLSRAVGGRSVMTSHS